MNHGPLQALDDDRKAERETKESYCVKSPEGHLFLESRMSDRIDAVCKWQFQMFSEVSRKNALRNWSNSFKNQGYKVVKVRIEEVNK